MTIRNLDITSRRDGWLPLAGFIVLTLAGGTLIGLMTAPGEWYAQLQKPPFNPPNWIFGPVWSLLYILIGIAGWRTWRVGSMTAMRLWWLQLVLNFAWSPVFFALHQIAAALVVVLALLVAVLAFIAVSRRDGDGASAGLFLPYVAWVSFASLLNASILWLN